MTKDLMEFEEMLERWEENLERNMSPTVKWILFALVLALWIIFLAWSYPG